MQSDSVLKSMFKKLLWALIVVGIAMGLGYFSSLKVKWLSPYAVAAAILWVISLIMLLRIKSERTVHVGRVIYKVANCLLLFLFVTFEVAKIHWWIGWGIVAVVVWFIVLGIRAVARTKTHVRSKLLEMQEQTQAPSLSDSENLDGSGEETRQRKVTRELFMELGLPMGSGASINIADFQEALRQSSYAKLTEANANFIAQILQSLKAGLITSDEAAARIKQIITVEPQEQQRRREESMSAPTRDPVWTQPKTKVKNGWRIL